MTRYVEQTNLFKRQVKLAKKRGQNIEKLQIVIQCLIKDNSLSAEYRDHKLVGNFGVCRECHIEPDWLSYIGLRMMVGWNLWKLALTQIYLNKIAISIEFDPNTAF